ncbi:MAG: hypothetical protein KBD78_00380 [Oligoflexales bacterium]|nr:hypothetical protein [Oligoflexales bacterium]
MLYVFGKVLQVSIAIVDSSKIKQDAGAKWDVITLSLEEGVLLSSGYILKLENVLPYPDLNAAPVESPVVVLSYSKAEVN